MPENLLKIREDLVITRQKQRDEIVFVVKDPVKVTYYRYSEMEYQVMALFNGNRTLEQVITEYNRIDPEAELDMESLKYFVATLKQNDIFKKSSSEKNLILLEKQRTYRKHRLLRAQGSVMYLRVPLLDPDKLLNKYIDKIRFFWTRWFFVVSLIAIILSYIIIALNWEQVYSSLKEMYSFGNQSTENVIRLWIVIIFVIALHEFGHAFTCKNFGGEVHEMGFLLLFFNPCLYANVNDAWTFPDKTKRLWVTFAGAYFEAFVGAIAVFIWWLTNPGIAINTYAYTALTICSVSSLAFNFNPLVKLDGYYAFSDYVEIANLKQRSSDYVSYLVKKNIFRQDVETDEEDKKTNRILFWYGFLSQLYIIFILSMVGMMFAGMLISSYHEVGIIAVGGILAFLFRKKLRAGLKSIWGFFMKPSKKWGIFSPKIMVLSAIVILFGLGFVVPKNIYIESECYLEPSEQITVRTQTDGFISAILVAEGEDVNKSQVLFNMENLSKNNELARFALDKRISDIDIQQYQSSGNPAGLQPKIVAKERIEQTIKIKQPEIDALTVKAGISGTIITSDLFKLNNAYVKKGTGLCEIASLSKMNIIIPVREEEAGMVDMDDQVEIKVNAFPYNTFSGKIISIGTKADTAKIGNPVKIKLEIDNKDRLLRIGMNGKSRILAETVTWNGFFLHLVFRTIRMDLWF